MRFWIVKLGIWCLTRYFKYVDIYSPKETVNGISFSNNKGFIDYISKFEK